MCSQTRPGNILEGAGTSEKNQCCQLKLSKDQVGAITECKIGCSRTNAAFQNCPVQEKKKKPSLGKKYSVLQPDLNLTLEDDK